MNPVINVNVEFRPQQQNARTHTERGYGRLEHSVREDGWIGAITVANDGECFDGSLRLEAAFPALGDVEPIVIESDGTRPIVHIRTDIPSATTKQAKRLSLAANRIAEFSGWSPLVLEEWSVEGITDEYWLPDEPKPWEPSVDQSDDGGKESSGPPPALVTCPECGHQFESGNAQ